MPKAPRFIERPVSELLKLVSLILSPEKKFYSTAIVYGIAISFLTLAIPVSVQTLITTVANTSLLRPVVTISIILFLLLIFSGILNALQVRLVEIFEQRFFARITSEILMRNVYAKYSYFEGINRAELVNRYFEIMAIQKNVPILLTSGFSLILQTVVGFIVVSLYHPAFLAFNLVFIFLIYVVLKIWGGRAIRASVRLSESKYDIAQWLEEMAMSNSFFKSEKYIMHAVKKTDDLTNKYILNRKRSFGYSFAQTVSLLIIYAIASSGLLGIGGYLVINSQLSLGQLVAAELILSAIFYGMSKFGYYLGLVYELIASCEKLSYFYNIPLEDEGGKLAANKSVGIKFDETEYEYCNDIVKFNFDIKPSEKIMASAISYKGERAFVNLVKRHGKASKGEVLIGKDNIVDYNIHKLREDIIVLDSMLIFECTINKYIRISAPNATSAEISEAIKFVGLDKVIDGLEDGLSTELLPTGFPLSSNEILRLKLAAALLANPKILILTEIFDTIPYKQRQKIITNICKIPELTFIYFSNRKDIISFDRYLYLTTKNCYFFDKVEDLREAEEKRYDE
jgi:putative ABC transport system ATP-binding protein